MKGAYSTLKKSAAQRVANTTKLSDRGATSIAGMSPACNGSRTFLARVEPSNLHEAAA
jgi:hypothetical protein